MITDNDINHSLLANTLLSLSAITTTQSFSMAIVLVTVARLDIDPLNMTRTISDPNITV